MVFGWLSIPNNVQTKTVGKDTVHTFTDPNTGRTVNVMKNPNVDEFAKGKKYVEVEVSGGEATIKNANNPNIKRKPHSQPKNDNGQFVSDPYRSSADAKDYSWIEKNRHPDPNVQSSFVSSKPTPSTNQYFKTETQWQAPGRGTGLQYKVYQQDIDLNARPFASRGDMRTNADLMANGQPPRVLKNGVYEELHLHHNAQDGRGALYELSKPAHQAKTGNGREALHPYGNNKHPDYPKSDNLFNKDRVQYWKDRLNQLRGN